MYNRKLLTQWERKYSPAAKVYVEASRKVRCRACKHQWRPTLPAPGWWACPQGCTDAFREQHPDLATEMDRAWPWAPPPPLTLDLPKPWWTPGQRRQWGLTALQSPFGICVHDFDGRILQCVKCGAVWQAEWEINGGRVHMPGWWRCRQGCNAWCADVPTYASTITAIEVMPPWDPPPELLTAALGGKCEQPPTPVAVLTERPGRPSREDRLRRDPEWRARVEEVRNLQATGRYTWDGLATRLGCDSGATVRRWVGALGRVETEEQR